MKAEETPELPVPKDVLPDVKYSCTALAWFSHSDIMLGVRMISPLALVQGWFCSQAAKGLDFPCQSHAHSPSHHEDRASLSSLNPEV